MSRKSKRHPVVLYQPRDEGAWMPLGLLALGSHLGGEHVVVVDGRFDLAPEARVAELAVDASCLGVTVRTGPPLRDALRVSAAARRVNPRLTVVWGGPHATYAPASCLATGVVDACARGAGEEALAGALGAVRNGGSLADVRGLLVQGGAMLPPLAPQEGEWAARARYSLLDVERHFQARGRRRLDYCSSRGTRELGLRGLAADRVAAELGELAERHRLSEVLFRDEDFFGDPARAEAIATALVEAPARFGWRVALRPGDVREGGVARLELLRSSGCRSVRVIVPPDVPGRGPVRDEILQAAHLLHQVGLAARFELTVSEPGPKLQGLAAAISLARTLSALDHSFETPLRRTAAVPPFVPGGADEVGIEEWIARAATPWPDLRAERRLRRASFYLAEGQRAPGRGVGKHLLRMLALLRTRLGYFGLDFERGAVELSAILRTGRPRVTPSLD